MIIPGPASVVYWMQVLIDFTLVLGVLGGHLIQSLEQEQQENLISRD